MFNPNPTINAVAIDDEHICYVVDNALAEPERWVAFAATHRAAFEQAPFNAYPGIEMPLTASVSSLLDDFFRLHIRAKLGHRRTLQLHSRLSMATLNAHELSPIQWLCHRDRLGVSPAQGVAASVLYLFNDESLGGTSFFRPNGTSAETEALMREAATVKRETFTAARGVRPGYLTESNAHFTRVCTVHARWNRIIFYDGAKFHSPDIREPAKLSPDVTRGRLTLNGFFTCSRIAV